MAKTTETVDAGTGDVFRDLGCTDAAALFGLPLPHVSELKHYKLNPAFSTLHSADMKARRVG